MIIQGEKVEGWSHGSLACGRQAGPVSGCFKLLRDSGLTRDSGERQAGPVLGCFRLPRDSGEQVQLDLYQQRQFPACLFADVVVCCCCFLLLCVT